MFAAKRSTTMNTRRKANQLITDNSGELTLSSVSDC